jgi:hypothetical protein
MAQPKRSTKDEDTFYEAMPATARNYGLGGNTVIEHEEEAELSDHDHLTVDDTKTTAVVTLILTALVTIGLALLFMRGLDIIQGTAPAPSSTHTVNF